MKIILLVISGFLGIQACSQAVVPKDDKAQKQTESENKLMKDEMNDNLTMATFGAGCFWCVEAVFQELQGVYSVESGYTGGEIDNPTYKQICTGNTGHAEVCQIGFNSDEISFEELLEVFWATHDPTTKNRQGNDVGTQYRSVIYYHDDEQKAKAENSLLEVGQKLWDDPIVTEISPLGKLYTAEKYHQNYYDLNPNQGYCRAIINPKVAKFRKQFKDKLKKNE